jgi:hypothetical protein
MFILFSHSRYEDCKSAIFVAGARAILSNLGFTNSHVEAGSYCQEYGPRTDDDTQEGSFIEIASGG